MTNEVGKTAQTPYKTLHILKATFLEVGKIAQNRAILWTLSDVKSDVSDVNMSCTFFVKRNIPIKFVKDNDSKLSKYFYLKKI